MRKIYRVQLEEEERQQLKQIINKGKAAAHKQRRARILLLADEEHEHGMCDTAIAESVFVSLRTVERTRQCFVEHGLETSLKRKNPDRQYLRKLDGRAEAHLIALACSKAPEGQARWTLRLLADQLVELEIVPSISHETVRATLHKNELKPWRKKQWCIPPKANAQFVCNMEDVLEVYARERNPLRPLVCMDETTKQLVDHTRSLKPMAIGRVEKIDYEYERKGVGTIFMMCAPLEGWREVIVTKRKQRVDYAHCLQKLAEVHFPDAEKIVLVQDNLNTHHPASLYEAFEPKKARELMERFEFHYTPKHGSWLNIAETELSVLGRQCLDRRIPTMEKLKDETEQWTKKRNEKKVTIDWQFKTSDARIKLKKLYPSIHD